MRIKLFCGWILLAEKKFVENHKDLTFVIQLMEKLKSRIFHSIAKIGGVSEPQKTMENTHLGVIRDWACAWDGNNTWAASIKLAVTLQAKAIVIERKRGKVTGIQRQWDKNLPGH